MPKIFDSELRFMQIVWEFAPVGSGELVKLAFERPGGKKSTVYTVIRRALPGFVAAFANAKAISREDAEAIRRIIDAYEEGER